MIYIITQTVTSETIFTCDIPDNICTDADSIDKWILEHGTGVLLTIDHYDYDERQEWTWEPGAKTND